jgi:NTE family protein
LGSAQAPERHNLIDLILLQRQACVSPRGSAAWSSASAPARLFHVRDGNSADIERVARVITGQAIGLVLSGGAARAFAHVGAIRVLRERNVPIDFVGGVSMGAVVGLGLAMGWSMEELESRIRKAFVDTSPLGDIALPLIALTHGRRVRERLTEHFGDRQICDLWLPFFCVSANLTTGGYQLHRRGLAREAVRASLSLPGVLPPVVDGGNVLVDGAVMNNYPADIMRSIQPGPIIGVDVSRGRSIDAEDLVNPIKFWRWLFTGGWRRGPPIVSILMRAATVSTGRDLAAARAAIGAATIPLWPQANVPPARPWMACKAPSPTFVAARRSRNRSRRQTHEILNSISYFVARNHTRIRRIVEIVISHSRKTVIELAVYIWKSCKEITDTMHGGHAKF